MYETFPDMIPKITQRIPIERLELWDVLHQETVLPVIEEFNVHKCWITGKTLISTPPESITTVVDRQLLVAFRDARLEEPAVGFSGLESFIRALRVLLRVIGNALHGEDRPVPSSSATITP